MSQWKYFFLIFYMVHECSVNICFESNSLLCKIFLCADFFYTLTNFYLNIHWVKMANVTHNTFAYKSR